MMESFERTYLKMIKGESKQWFVPLLKSSLLILSWVYQGVTCVRNKAFDFGFLKSFRSNIPVVVSIGNISVGGTGKTPVAMLLTRELSKSLQTAILSRGYRSLAEKLRKPLVLSRGNGPEYPVGLCGDEPYLLARSLPGTHIYVGRNRCEAALMASENGVDIAILDDGMQHRKLSRDFDLVVMDAMDPFGQGYMLPRGLLREGPRALNRADLIVLNRVESKAHYLSVRKEIERYTSAPVVGTRVTSTRVVDTRGNEISDFEGKKVGMFCGIGSPEGFEKTLLDMGVEVMDRLLLDDHATIDPNVLQEFAEQCRKKGCVFIVCTEKDIVKAPVTLATPLPIVWIEMRLTPCEGLEHWKAFLKKIRTMKNQKKCAV
jgi:tetraacyldisaccharide 4'-kinase